MCATILKPVERGGEHHRGFFGWFNRQFERLRDRYILAVRKIIARFRWWLVGYAMVIAAVVLLFMRMPATFLPDEDQGDMFMLVQLPAGSTQGQTAAVLEEVNQYLLKNEKRVVDGAFQVSGFNFAGRGQSQGLLFVPNAAGRPERDLRA